MSFRRSSLLRQAALVLMVIGVSSPLMGRVAFISVEEASVYPSFPYQGEYAGEVIFRPGGEAVDVGLQVAAYGENEFRALLHHGGLPGAQSSLTAAGRVLEMGGKYTDHILELKGEGPLRLLYSLNGFTVVGEGNRELGRLGRVRRESATIGMEAPADAIVLFDGTHLDHWRGGSVITEEGWLKEGATTADDYGDFRLHLEVKLPFMPENEGQGRGNSGIYIQNRYEVQILDSFAMPPLFDGNTSLYRTKAPDLNATYSPLNWQTYDVFFRAPRFDEAGAKTENARITVYLNGVLVQDDVELESGTGAGGRRAEVARAELYLQNHSDPVRFRNIWLVDGEYSPPGTSVLTK